MTDRFQKLDALEKALRKLEPELLEAGYLVDYQVIERLKQEEVSQELRQLLGEVIKEK